MRHVETVFWEQGVKAERSLKLRNDVDEMPFAMKRRLHFQQDAAPLPVAGKARNFPSNGLGAGDRSNGHHDPRTSRP